MEDRYKFLLEYDRGGGSVAAAARAGIGAIRAHTDITRDLIKEGLIRIEAGGGIAVITDKGEEKVRELKEKINKGREGN